MIKNIATIRSAGPRRSGRAPSPAASAAGPPGASRRRRRPTSIVVRSN